MDFWAFYLQEHSRPATRRMHVAGTSLAFGCILAAALLFEPWFLLAAALSGYAFAWVGHLAFEHNRPATFKHPWRSLAADWKMWALTLMGRMPRELERHGVAKGS